MILLSKKKYYNDSTYSYRENRISFVDNPEQKELNRLIEYWEENLPALCDHASEKERDSIDCERDVESMKMAEYMESHIGEEYDGTISSVMNFGLFVQLDNMIEEKRSNVKEKIKKYLEGDKDE